MTRHVVLGNQRLLVNLDESLCIRDVYFPHVGQENHVLGEPQRIGVYTDHISWFDEDAWDVRLQCDRDTLINNATLANQHQNVKVEVRSFVDCDSNVLLRRFRVTNLSGNERRIGLFFYHNFQLYGDGIGDTTGYDPLRKSMFSYKRKRYAFLSLATADELAGGESSLSDYTVGQINHPSYHDAEDGVLQKNAIAQGDVDSCVAKFVTVGGGESEDLWFVLCFGSSFDEVHKLQDSVLEKHPDTFLERTRQSIAAYLEQDDDFGNLDEDFVELYERSLLVVRSQIDHDGAILAANDSENMLFNRDTYSYLWPRDGALVAMALDKAGKKSLTERYFRFCSKLLYEDGCFLHKYNPDGSIGSSWQAWIREGEPFLPIQEDETGLQLFALWKHHERYKGEGELFDELYNSFIVPAAGFLERWWDAELGVTKESWDLWEERVNISAWTCAAKHAGLVAAARFAHLKDDPREKAWLARADEVRASVERHLYNEELGRFVSQAYVKDGVVEQDLSLDASTVGLWMFELFKCDDPRIKRTMLDLEKALSVPTDIGGVCRNEKDYYHYRGDGFATVKGNPWIITSCWFAKYKAATATSSEDLLTARAHLEWVLSRQLPTGLLPEQVHPFTGESVGVCPLTWSHAELVDAVHWYLDAHRRLS